MSTTCDEAPSAIAVRTGSPKSRGLLERLGVFGSTRVKLFLLIALALTPLIGFRAYDLASMRDERIESTKTRALDLARDGAERQGGLVAQASAILDVAVQVPALRNADRAGCAAFLTQIKQQTAWAGGFGLIDLNGRPFCSNDVRFRDADLSDREYFKEALRTEQVYVSSLLLARTTGRPIVVIARAVRDVRGQPSGVLIATLDLAWLGKLVRDVGASGSGVTLLLDRTGNVLARSPEDPRFIGRNLADVPTIEAALKKQEGVSEGVGADGVLRLGAMATIPISGEKLIVAFDKSIAVAQADAEMMWNVIRFAVLVVGAALLAWLGGEFLFLRWVRRLAAAAEQLGRGEFRVDARVPAMGGELAAVDRALQAAAYKLGQRDQALRAAEAVAREANQRLVMAEHIAQIGHWRVDLPSNALTWSDGVYLIHGLDRDTYSPAVDTAITAYHPEDRAAIAASVAEAIQHARNFENTLRIVRTDGEVRTVVSRGICEIDAKGRPAALFGTIMDVTELHRAEREVMQTSALLKTTLESIDQGLMVVSADGRIEICNVKASELLGIPADYLAAKPTTRDVLELQWQAGEFEDAPEPVRRFIRDGGIPAGPHEYVRTRPNGTVLEIRTMPMAGGGIVRTYADITARSAALAAVGESEARYRLLAENSSDVITRLGLNFRRDYVSPACKRLLGFEPEEMIGVQPSATIHPDDAPAVRDLASELVGGRIAGNRATVAYRMRHKQGHWVWIEAGMTLALDQAGVPVSIICSLRDVSERMAAEAARAESESRYRLLADHSSDLIALRPRAGGTRSYVSPSAHAMLGYRPEELLDMSAVAYVHPDDLARVEGDVASLSMDKPQVTNTHRIRRKDGSWLWIEAVFTLTGSGGPSESLIVRARDVDLRQRTEIALSESEARYRLLADNASDLIVLGHANGRRSYISPAVRTMLGYSVEEAYAIGMHDWAHPDDLGKVLAATKALTRDDPTGAVIYRLKHKNGHYVWAEAAFRRVEDCDEVTVVTAIRDVTERQRQAQDLEKAKAAAEAGARIKAEFLANMSHELRTPLTGMLGVHDILQADESLGDRQRRLVSLAQEAGRSLLAIVNDVLDFSKIEAGQMAFETVPFGLRELIESCRQLAAETIGAKMLRLDACIDPDVPELVLGDPTRIRQILLNLTTNAIKFTSEGSVTVKATWPAERLKIEVSDTGIGIAAESIPHLFDRFSQADGSTARHFGGTGLGLAICKSLVELMGGVIGVESAPGSGSTLWFELPLVRAEPERPERQPSQAAADHGPRRRILLAEDNMLNQEIIQTVLTSVGHEVILVSDGSAALEACRTGNFDIVLMDVQMPGMDGLTAAAAIRDTERAGQRPRVPIVALTANAMIEDAERCREAGMDTHVAKPIDWIELFGVIERICAASSSARALGGEGVAAVLDEGILDTLASILNRERVGDLLLEFRADIERRLAVLAAPATTPNDLARHAHSLLSLAGQLGFAELSLLCADLERASLRGGGLDQLSTLERTAARAIEAATRSSYAKAA